MYTIAQTCNVGDGMAKRERFATDHRKHTTEMCVYVEHGPYAYNYPLQPTTPPYNPRQPITPPYHRQPCTATPALGRPVASSDEGIGSWDERQRRRRHCSVASLVHRQNLMSHFYRTTA